VFVIRLKQLQLPLGGKRFTLSIENAQVLIARAIERGDVLVPDSFKSCCTTFSTVDVERIIKTTIPSDPEHLADEMWLFRFVGTCETRVLEATVALDLSEDLDCPQVLFVEARCRRMQ
jgi:hypothetical protein